MCRPHRPPRYHQRSQARPPQPHHGVQGCGPPSTQALVVAAHAAKRAAHHAAAGTLLHLCSCPSGRTHTQARASGRVLSGTPSLARSHPSGNASNSGSCADWNFGFALAARDCDAELGVAAAALRCTHHPPSGCRQPVAFSTQAPRHCDARATCCRKSAPANLPCQGKEACPVLAAHPWRQSLQQPRTCPPLCRSPRSPLHAPGLLRHQQ
mmetsp:Transcript_68130/g.158111  ORF Transcript_68130/g.158111 Transcript_68130/m.158111 type:complete len:210 (-) Transcript_68130:160-789(-)